MNGLGMLLAVLVSALAGAVVGFLAGLVPGLHMNNFAAAVTAYPGAFLGTFAILGASLGSQGSGLLVSSFISSAVVSHVFAESISSTYVGIPSGDVVSVLPAHRLAKGGLGTVAVSAASDGALAGVLIGCITLLPFCALMGEPVRVYEHLSAVMGPLVIGLSTMLVLSEGWPSFKMRHHVPHPLAKSASGACVFLAAGLLGLIVLDTHFGSSEIPDFPWIHGMVSKSSLLLPLFAGLFGVPSIILSLGSRQVVDASRPRLSTFVHPPCGKDAVLCLLGGALVGWLPGMTSGSAATVSAPGLREESDNDLRGATRFIWLYSSISASGSVFALGALFVLSRARSGSMDAVRFFLGQELAAPWQGNLALMCALLLSFLVSAVLSHALLRFLSPRLAGLARALCSRELALASMCFVCSLSAYLTGTRGLFVLATAVLLGLIPPLAGVRRIQLMGCLLVPIAFLFIPV